MTWYEVLTSKKISYGMIDYAWHKYKQEHITDYDFTNGAWWECMAKWLQEEADEEYVAKHSFL